MTLLIDNSVVQKVLKMDECIEIQDEAFRGLATGASTHRPRVDMYVPCDREDGYYRWGTMEGASKDLGVFAIRMKSDIAYWPRDEQGYWTEEKYCIEPGQYCGLIFLFSTRNGEPLAIINDGVLQHMRVGAGAGLGAKYLARENAQVVGMLGSGGMARSSFAAFCAVRDIRRVQVFSPTREHREAYAAEMSREFEVEAVPMDDAASAVRGADIICLAADAMDPIVKGAWLEPGMHITNPGGRMDEEGYQRADLVVRQGVGGWRPVDLGGLQLETGRGHSPAAFIAGDENERARLPEPDPRPSITLNAATFADLATGKATGRTSDSQITLYLDIGNQGLQFAAVGALAYRKAVEQGLGRQLPTEWFMQDIRD